MAEVLFSSLAESDIEEIFNYDVGFDVNSSQKII